MNWKLGEPSLWEQWTDMERQRAYEGLLKENWSLRHAARDWRDAFDSVERIVLETRCCPGGPALTVKRLKAQLLDLIGSKPAPISEES